MCVCVCMKNELKKVTICMRRLEITFGIQQWHKDCIHIASLSWSSHHLVWLWFPAKDSLFWKESLSWCWSIFWLGEWMQYVNTPVNPRIAWLPLALPASYWLKRYHCLFCKHWAMFVSKVTVVLLLLCREGEKSWFKHLGASCLKRRNGGEQEKKAYFFPPLFRRPDYFLFNFCDQVVSHK